MMRRFGLRRGRQPRPLQSWHICAPSLARRQHARRVLSVEQPGLFFGRSALAGISLPPWQGQDHEEPGSPVDQEDL